MLHAAVDSAPHRVVGRKFGHDPLVAVDNVDGGYKYLGLSRDLASRKESIDYQVKLAPTTSATYLLMHPKSA
jgi:hypothetical protein